MNVCEIAGQVAKPANPDQILRSAESNQGLHCSLRTAFHPTQSKYGNFIKSNLLRHHPGSVSAGLLSSGVFAS